ncbi:ParA family protein [Sphingomonadales bacterium 56]|uniref:CobQ/CobB/MinD/ParA nucleotide binding domain-containing protein n=1 Tax=Sphingobium indicum TaxID=332055 RepID=A0A4Q4ISK6_9SPHN|nr:ParA family protein [Sphingomonadales bacterium 56]MBY2960756.1 ParA family protein [Sphingomonadales bacterium 58]NYI25030.1 cellulose biosynthesis protein BcsQ [Sphingobium indicum]CAD7341784.1 Iron-sulfur cluster carrier protein [Sphingobium sp. S6]CAD7341877.1 Iron-sulfur cluster carrier protein [Sphingobium sp. S8]
MPVVALASSKGGCGKSTTALILASAIVAAGYKVRIIDADRSARLAKWALSTAEQKSAIRRRKTRPSCYMPGGVA